jgi:hypothetical protein
MESAWASSSAARSQARTVNTRLLYRTGLPTAASNRTERALTLSRAWITATS